MAIAFIDRVAPYVERVASIAPVARQYADWSEQHARPANELVEALRDADLFRLLVPESMGGAGLSPWELGPVIEALARVDGSAGWTMALGQGLLGQLVKPDLFKELFGNPRLTMAGSLNPTSVRATRIDGGYRFSGKGTYVSGCTHASWMVAIGSTGTRDVVRETGTGSGRRSPLASRMTTTSRPSAARS